VEPGPPNLTRRPVLWISLSAACILSILLCITCIDLPLADCAHAAFGTGLFKVAIAILTALRAMLVPMALFAVGCGAWRLAGRRLPAWARPFVKAVLAAAVAVIITLALKVAIGRSQPYPHYTSNHIHEFRPFWADRSYRAFPSGTMAVASAFLAVLCLKSAGRRWFAGTVLILIAACVVITNGHWLADILGGFYLGTIMGWLILRGYHRVTAPQQSP
jgi:membrane-associated phospholipid phosphatase